MTTRVTAQARRRGSTRHAASRPQGRRSQATRLPGEERLALVVLVTALGLGAALRIWLSFNDDGILAAIYTNGQNINLSQIAMAKFENPEGMFKMGQNRFRESVGTHQSHQSQGHAGQSRSHACNPPGAVGRAPVAVGRAPVADRDAGDRRCVRRLRRACGADPRRRRSFRVRGPAGIFVRPLRSADLA